MIYKKLSPLAIAPYRGSAMAVGYDLTCIGFERLPGLLIKLRTGLAVQPKDSSWFKLVARSSLYKRGLAPTNGFGVIDPDYTGEIQMVCEIIDFHAFNIWDKSSRDIRFRFAQLVKAPLLESDPQEANISTTKRGAGGFGSTGE